MPSPNLLEKKRLKHIQARRKRERHQKRNDLFNLVKAQYENIFLGHPGLFQKYDEKQRSSEEICKTLHVHGILVYDVETEEILPTQIGLKSGFGIPTVNGGLKWSLYKLWRFFRWKDLPQCTKKTVKKGKT